MRIVCHTIGAFIENLIDRNVFEKTVWIDRTKQEINENKFLVNFQASAVIMLGKDGDILLQYGEDCGYDHTDGEVSCAGTEQMEKGRKQLVEYCRSVGLIVKPGVVDM